MREIKFRGKRLDTGEWVFGYYYTQIITHAGNRKSRDHFMRTEQNIRYEVDPDTVGQYTGLKDKNGQEIYEGDILSFDGNMTADNSMGAEPNGFIYDENSKHAVVWNETLALWELNFAEDEIWKYKRDTRGLMIDGHCKVIGNIYENPELLEEGNHA
jgi:uncharacterized phage protein (TIGR01671 family)